MICNGFVEYVRLVERSNEERNRSVVAGTFSRSVVQSCGEQQSIRVNSGEHNDNKQTEAESKRR